MFEPAIKWSGSKRSQAEEIVKLFPKEIDTYYEPFCGGCSVLRRLLSSDIKVNHYICSDLNGDLINLSGKKYHAKKNNVNKFKKLYNYEYSKITSADTDECLELYNKWYNSTMMKSTGVVSGEEYEELIAKHDIKNGFMREEMLFVHEHYKSLDNL